LEQLLETQEDQLEEPESLEEGEPGESIGTIRDEKLKCENNLKTVIIKLLALNKYWAVRRFERGKGGCQEEVENYGRLWRQHRRRSRQILAATQTSRIDHLPF
jgi:hypothetical protein